MKTILFYAAGDEHFPGRLDAVLDIARSFDAHLTLLHSFPYETGAIIEPYGAAFATLLPIWRDAAERLKDRTVADLRNESVSWNWIEAAGSAASAMSREAALQDLVIVGAREPLGSTSGPSYSAGELAMTAGCPVLVLPDTCKRFDVGATAMVAWDGSAEASHALKAAVPFLRLASEVYLITVEEPVRYGEAPDLPPLDGAEYLSRHGISSQIVEVQQHEAGVAATIQAAAEIRHVGMIVMGAYGRKRLTERIFGGVTRDMLSDVRLPLLMTN